MTCLRNYFVLVTLLGDAQHFGATHCMCDAGSLGATPTYHVGAPCHAHDARHAVSMCAADRMGVT